MDYSVLSNPAFLNICPQIEPLGMAHLLKVLLEVTGDDVVTSYF